MLQTYEESSQEHDGHDPTNRELWGAECVLKF